MTRTRPRITPLPALLGLCVLCACASPSPDLTEGDIPGYRTLDVDYDETRLQVFATAPHTEDEYRLVATVGRKAMARYVEARSTDGTGLSDGRFRGQLSLPRGWRQEFFPLAPEQYEATDRLPEGALYFDPSPSGVSRDVGPGWLVRGRSDWFSGFITTVIEVPAEGGYVLGLNSDEGIIVTLQNLAHPEALHLLWYEWRWREMRAEPSEVRTLLEAGTYLLTVHYYEGTGEARYSISMIPDPDEEGTAIPLSDSPPPVRVEGVP